MHLGSLFTAAAGFLDARAHGGQWLLRIEDLDLARNVPGAADRILRILEAHGLCWDQQIIRQHSRIEVYETALERLRALGHTYACSCSRREIGARAVYPGTCRNGPRSARDALATRVRVPAQTIEFDDRVQGRQVQNPAETVGDFIVRRRDGVFAYRLAVIVDDADQRITRVVRGADLLDDTPAQILLQRMLGLPQPQYAHVPVLAEPDGSKLAKSRRSLPLNPDNPTAQVVEVLELLGLGPPPELGEATPAECWGWAAARWRIENIGKTAEIRLRPAAD